MERGELSRAGPGCPEARGRGAAPPGGHTSAIPAPRRARGLEASRRLSLWRPRLGREGPPGSAMLLLPDHTLGHEDLGEIPFSCRLGLRPCVFVELLSTFFKTGEETQWNLTADTSGLRRGPAFSDRTSWSPQLCHQCGRRVGKSVRDPTAVRHAQKHPLAYKTWLFFKTANSFHLGDLKASSKCLSWLEITGYI